MIPALARALWPFFVRFSAPSLPWIARAGGGGPQLEPASTSIVRIAHIQYPQTSYAKQFGGAADFGPALGSPEETLPARHATCDVRGSSPGPAGIPILIAIEKMGVSRVFNGFDS
jgi:hypothetical protein